jgi:hypothetical protein
MAGAQRQSALSVVKRSLAAEGPAFFFRGFWPAWTRLGPNTVAVFMASLQVVKFAQADSEQIYEQLRHLVDFLHED